MSPSAKPTGKPSDPRTDPSCAVVYDGSCRFCRRQMDYIRRRAPAGRFCFVPSQSPDLLDRFPALAGEAFHTGLRLVLPDGRVRAGADAVYEIARRLPLWRHLAWLYHVPGLHGLARWVYRWIAARRYALAGSCETDACRTRSKDEAGSA